MFNAICISLYLYIYLYIQQLCIFVFDKYIYILFWSFPPCKYVGETRCFFGGIPLIEISFKSLEPPKEIIDADASGTLQITDPWVKVGRLEMVSTDISTESLLMVQKSGVKTS